MNNRENTTPARPISVHRTAAEAITMASGVVHRLRASEQAGGYSAFWATRRLRIIKAPNQDTYGGPWVIFTPNGVLPAKADR